MARWKKQEGQSEPPASGPGSIPPTPEPDFSQALSIPGDPFLVVGIGASAGGLKALESLFRSVRPDSGIAYVVVTHLQADRESYLPELLGGFTDLPVQEICDGDVLVPDRVFILSPGSDLSCRDGALILIPRDPARGHHLPIDAFLRALAEDRREYAGALILSGTGGDGSSGCRSIKEAGGIVLVQDQASAAEWGMPGATILTGTADYVLPPHEIPAKLQNYATHLRDPGRRNGIATDPDSPQKLPLTEIIDRLHRHTGHDFSLYKDKTLSRPIERRMHVLKIETLDTYAEYIRSTPRELDSLFHDILIGVTQFFRDPKAFDALSQGFLPGLIARTRKENLIRVWVPGCSTGEEAYSLAILMYEHMVENSQKRSLQIFATDINERAIEWARAGNYPASIEMDVSPERLDRHFTKTQSGYRINKHIRDQLIFASQDLIKDPPFTRLDLISCRNLLIYFGSVLQKRLMPMLGYSLNQGGVLFLGTSESVGAKTELFRTLDRKWKIYQKLGDPKDTQPLTGFPHVSGPRSTRKKGDSAQVPSRPVVSSTAIMQAILENSAEPPCLIVNEVGNITFVHGKTGDFLEPSQGEMSTHILALARPGLKAALGEAIREASRSLKEATRPGLQVHTSAGVKLVEIRVKPFPSNNVRPKLLKVVFLESPSDMANRTSRESSGDKNRDFEQMERERLDTRDSLQVSIEELETANEELRITNEELQSTNEEFQSTVEELETSKEELQSLNEESCSVNAELQQRLDDLSNAYNDIKNLLESTRIAAIFLDVDLNVRFFTPQVTRLVPLQLSDVGRSIRHFATRLDLADQGDLGDLAQGVLETLERKTIEARDRAGVPCTLRIMAYRTVNNAVNGVVLTFETNEEEDPWASALGPGTSGDASSSGRPAGGSDA